MWLRVTLVETFWCQAPIVNSFDAVMWEAHLIGRGLPYPRQRADLTKGVVRFWCVRGLNVTATNRRGLRHHPRHCKHHFVRVRFATKVRRKAASSHPPCDIAHGNLFALCIFVFLHKQTLNRYTLIVIVTIIMAIIWQINIVRHLSSGKFDRENFYEIL